MTQVSNYKVVHPEHSTYLTQIKEVKLDTFFNLLDKIDAQKRDEILSLVYSNMFESKTVIFTTPVHTILRGMAKYRYNTFKRKCFTLSRTLSDTFLVHSIVSCVLLTLYHSNDKLSRQKKDYYSNLAVLGRDISIMLNQENYNSEQLKAVEIDEESRRMLSVFDQQQLEKMLATIDDELRQTELLSNRNETKSTNYDELYDYFCREVVATLNA